MNVDSKYFMAKTEEDVSSFIAKEERYLQSIDEASLSMLVEHGIYSSELSGLLRYTNEKYITRQRRERRQESDLSRDCSSSLPSLRSRFDFGIPRGGASVTKILYSPLRKSGYPRSTTESFASNGRSYFIERLESVQSDYSLASEEAMETDGFALAARSVGYIPEPASSTLPPIPSTPSLIPPESSMFMTSVVSLPMLSTKPEKASEPDFSRGAPVADLRPVPISKL